MKRNLKNGLETAGTIGGCLFLATTIASTITGLCVWHKAKKIVDAASETSDDSKEESSEEKEVASDDEE